MARLSVARLISMTGTQVAYVALSVAVMYQRSGGSGAWVSAALLVIFGLRILVSPVAGGCARRSLRTGGESAIASDIASAATFVGICVCPLTAAARCDRRFHSSRRGSVSIDIGRVSGDACPGVAACVGYRNSFLKCCCWERSRCSVGGLLVATLGGAGSFLINAASFVLSAAFVSRIRGVYRAETVRRRFACRSRAGVRFIARTRALRLVVMSSGPVLLGVGMINVAEDPLFVSIGSGSFAWGAAVAGWGVGQLVGS